MYDKGKRCIPGIPRLNYVFYRTDNLINRKYYYGVHATDCLDDGYLGSGEILKKAIKKYSKENFIRTDLEFFDNMEDAYSKEAQVVTEELLKDPNCYNSKPGGLGGLKDTTTILFQGKYQRIPVNFLQYYLNLGAEHKSSRKGKPSPLKGRKQSEEHIKHRSEALKGHRGYPGKKKPDGFGNKIRQARLGAEGHTEGKVRMWKDGEQIFVKPSDISSKEQEGWIVTRGHRFVFKEGEQPLFVSQTEISTYLKMGYKKITYNHVKALLNGTGKE